MRKDRNKADIDEGKPDIDEEKPYIGEEKADIERKLSDLGKRFSMKTMIHAYRLFESYGYEGIFGRSMVCEQCGLKQSGASDLLSKLLSVGVIEPVKGYGKGKYRFKKLDA